MPSLSTLPKGDSAWLLRKAIERIMQQVSVLETNIGSSTTGNSSNGQVIFNDNGTLRGDADMTFNTALNKFIVNSLEVSTTAIITGNVGIGVTPSAGKGCLQLSSGITFPVAQVASSDANTLDDYEEGTWTATLIGSITNPTTPVTATGRYTKIGRQVQIQLAISGVDTTGASGSVRITGVPFAPAEISFGVLQSELGITFTGTLGCYIAASATTIVASASASDSARADGTHNAGANRFFWLNITYTV